MITIRNALLAAAVGGATLVAPVATSAQVAGAEPVAQALSAAPVTAFAAHPCRLHKNPAKCYARWGGGPMDDDDNITNPSGSGIDE
ncbi:hypothetical protein [Nonomuraea sp. NPDC003804]|uniref:hypothetical protein n=1 Tax=Nonomuraea sp. NPDC003804 TaxID=3154547 RepID=UPI0033A930A8